MLPTGRLFTRTRRRPYSVRLTGPKQRWTAQPLSSVLLPRWRPNWRKNVKKRARPSPRPARIRQHREIQDLERIQALEQQNVRHQAAQLKASLREEERRQEENAVSFRDVMTTARRELAEIGNRQQPGAAGNPTNNSTYQQSVAEDEKIFHRGVRETARGPARRADPSRPMLSGSTLQLGLRPARGVSPRLLPLHLRPVQQRLQFLWLLGLLLSLPLPLLLLLQLLLHPRRLPLRRRKVPRSPPRLNLLPGPTYCFRRPRRTTDEARTAIVRDDYCGAT